MVKKKKTSSLLEPEARGGDVAESGFSFQEQVTLSYLPSWLAHDGFTAMIREAIGDTEAKFFIPGHGFAVDLLEVKNHNLAPVEFWREIERFQELDKSVPGTYRRFTLACAGLSELLHPVYHGLRRIRDPRDFYPDTSAVAQHSWADYVQIVSSLGRTERDAFFLFDKVVIHPDFNTAQTHGEALFAKALVDHLPSFQNLSGRVIRDIYERLSLLLRGRRNQPIARREVEACIDDVLTPEQRPPLKPVSITTLADQGQLADPTDLVLDWVRFFGGTTRSYPPSKEWNDQLLRDLLATRDWVMQHERPRRIRLRGSRRLSAGLAIGSVFSAVAGFALEMEYRGALWATDTYATSTTPIYSLQNQFQEGEGDQLIVTIGILREIAPDVRRVLPSLRIEGAPQLDLYGSVPVESSQHANVIVRAIKNEIAATLSRSECKLIHLFYAGPSHLAVFLGHRFNATAPIQCYEYVGPAIYTPTCCLV